MLPHLNAGFGITVAVGIGGDLQALSGEGDGVIIGHRAGVFEAKESFDLIRFGPRDIGGTSLGWLDLKTLIVGEQEIQQHLIGFYSGGCPGLAQGFDQPILQGTP